MQQTTRDWETNETASILSWNLVIFLCPNTTWLMRQNKDNFLLFGSIVCVIFLLFPLRLPSLLQQLLPSACNLAHFVLQQKSFSSLISDFNQLWRFALKVKSVKLPRKSWLSDVTILPQLMFSIVWNLINSFFSVQLILHQKEHNFS